MNLDSGIQLCEEGESSIMDIDDLIPLNKKKERKNFELKVKKEAEARILNSCFEILIVAPSIQ
jgi:hypothetical protein